MARTYRTTVRCEIDGREAELIAEHAGSDRLPPGWVYLPPVIPNPSRIPWQEMAALVEHNGADVCSQGCAVAYLVGQVALIYSPAAPATSARAK